MPAGQVTRPCRTTSVAVALVLCFAVVGLFAPRATAAECPSDIDARPVLRRGSVHPCVHVLEEFLRGYDRRAPRRLKVDDSFRADTRAAVIDFQVDFGIKDERGVVGQPTWAQIVWIAQLQHEPHPFAQRFPKLHIYGASNTGPIRRELVRVFSAVGVPEVVVDAVPGTATSDGGRSALSRLKARIDRGDVPDLIIVATGINDVHRVRRVQPGVDHIRDPNARRLAYRQILTGFVSTFMSYVDGLPTNPTVVWLTIAKANPNVVTDDVFNEVLLQEQQRRNAASDPGASALSILDVAKEMVDHPEFYVSDGIHLTKKGQEFRVRCHLALLDEQASLDLSRVLTCPSQGPSSAVAADSP